MRLIKKDDFVLENNKIILCPIGDVHYGSKYCDVKKFKENIDWIRDVPCAYVLGMGDFIETGIKSSVGGSIYEQNKFVQEQFDDMCEILSPLAKKGKILGFLSSNHPRRIFNDTGLDVDKLMSDRLGIPYCGHSTFLKLRVGEQNYSVYAVHGSSGAKLPQTQIKACLDLARYIEADIYLHGHLHTLNNLAQTFYRINMRKGIIGTYERHFILTGSYLNYGGYAEEKNLIPSKIGSPKLKLHSEERMIKVSL